MAGFDIKQLARLARLDVGAEEAPRLAEQLGRMLDAFALVDDAKAGTDARATPLREDLPVEPDAPTVEAIRAAFPARKGDALDVGGLR